jgi:hypothetical protein
MFPGMAPDQLDRIWRHPLQERSLNVVAQLLTALRMCNEHADYYEFQRNLGREIYEHGQQEAGVAQAVKRLSKGLAIQANAPQLQNGGDPTDLEAWRDEQATYERVSRQFRSVGDALAWRAVNYNRRYIVAMSRNQHVGGPMARKAGLDFELGRLDFEWKHNRRFTLLHDLTNCVRIGDVTVFTSDGPVIDEVKSKRRVSAKQRDRMRQAVAAAAEGGVLPGTEAGLLVDVPVDAKHHMTALGDALDLAESRGVAGFAVRGGRRGVVAASLLTLGRHPNLQAMDGRWTQAENNSMFKAGFSRQHPHLEIRSTDATGRHAMLPPFGIYPLPARQCAQLVCDALMFEVRMPVAAVVGFATEAGMDVVSHLAADPRGQPGDEPGLELHYGSSRLTLTVDALRQQLQEFVDFPTYMRGLRFLLEQTAPARQPYPVFGNDRRLWR